MDKSTNVQPLKVKPIETFSKHRKWKTPEENTRVVKQTADKGISERELQIGLIDSCHRLRIARPPRLGPTREIKTETIRNEDIKVDLDTSILDQIKQRLSTSLDDESLEDINGNLVADDDTGTDDEDYSIPEYSDSESTISTDVEQEIVKKPETPVYEVERKTSMVFTPVRIENPPKKNPGVPDDVVILRQKKDSSSSVTDSNIDITQKDSCCHAQESSGDDQPSVYFTDKVSERWSDNEVKQNIDSANNIVRSYHLYHGFLTSVRNTPVLVGTHLLTIPTVIVQHGMNICMPKQERGSKDMKQ
ncbi:unnamed protein product [Allacma fusca]|uniref:Uncharacterized protein n=1 Tax=Allacma fusca TaxID=39272 RepID=A0A8J2JBU7_9HEXA|nr:unnamed protein product [Allacma fusca]